MKISVLCPTRKRPQNMHKLCSSLYDTADNPQQIELIFYIDSDDEQSVSMFDLLDSKYENISYVSGERIVLSQMWNECWKVAKGEIYFHCGDDIIMRTPGWDTEVINKFNQYEDHIMFVHGNDLYHPFPGFGTHGFIHRNWTDTVGYFVPPYFSSDYNDTWLNEVSDMIMRHFSVPIITEHMHFVVNKSEIDETHRDRLIRHKNDNVDALYRSLHHERVSDAEKLQEFIDNFEDEGEE